MLNSNKMSPVDGFTCFLAENQWNLKFLNERIYTYSLYNTNEQKFVLFIFENLLVLLYLYLYNIKFYVNN